MPNWIVNILNVSGTFNSETGREDVVAFLKKHLHTRTYDHNTGEVETFFDFNTIIPAPDKEWEYVPKQLRLGKGPQPNIAWRRKNWHCKWNSLGNQNFDYQQILAGNKGVSGEIQIVFRTAWSPPLPVLKKLILMHPELDITCDYYSLESMIAGYIGKDVFDKDIIVHEQFKIDVNCKYEEL